MRVIIAGDRNEEDRAFVWGGIAAAQAAGLDITEVISGACVGVDRLGELWAQVHGVPVEMYPAAWEKYGRAAGPIRNGMMAQQADALIAIHRNLSRSRGTKDMIQQARVRGLQIFLYDGQLHHQDGTRKEHDGVTD